MSNVLVEQDEVKVVGKSWVIQLSEVFINENNLPKNTQVLLTFKESDKVEAEILPPLYKKLETIANKVLKKRRKLCIPFTIKYKETV
jgi:hypothetical protein